MLKYFVVQSKRPEYAESRIFQKVRYLLLSPREAVHGICLAEWSAEQEEFRFDISTGVIQISAFHRL